jgi:long-subunit acyl-CoA synthetase (AMP-forming)
LPVSTLPALTLPTLLCRQAEQRGDAVAMRHKRRGVWQSWTWRDVREKTERLAGALVACGVGPGDRVAVTGSPQPQLATVLVALHAVGAVPVLLAGDEPARRHALLAGVRLGFAADPRSAEHIRSLAHDDLTVFLINAGRADRTLLTYDGLLASGDGARHTLDARTIDPGQTAFILAAADNDLIRSLSHQHVVDQARAAAAALDAGPLDRLFQVMQFGCEPALLLGPALSLLCGSTLFFPESNETLLQDLREAGPTVLVAPPLLLRQLRRAVFVQAAASRAGWRRRLERTLDLYGEQPPPRNGLSRLLGDITIRRPVSDQIGLSRVRVAVTFGCAVPPALVSFCDAIGLKPRSAATLIEIPPDGATDDLELELRGSLFVRETVTARARDGARVALLFLDTEAIAAWAQTAGLTVAGTDTLVDMPEVHELVASEVKRVNQRVPETLRVDRFRLVVEHFALASGEVTVDGRLRREPVIMRHAADLAALGAAPLAPHHAEAAA